MKISTSVTGRAKFRRVALKLREQSGEIVRTESTSSLVNAAPPVLAAVQAKVRGADFPAAPSKGGGGHTGLRDHLADSTKTRAYGMGVRFVVADPRGQTMARYTEGVDLHTRWRHPVYGNANRWVQQRSNPWFFPTINDHESTFTTAMERALRRIMQRLK